MKIALPSNQDRIDDHFGHCAYFTVFTADPDSGVLMSREIVESPAGCGCKSNIAWILADMGVSVMLAGNMGDGAVQVLNAAGIQVLRGCTGNVEQAARDFLGGRLADNGVGCHEHGHDCSHH